MFLKINWSVKTPWHRLSIGDACSVLYLDSLPKTWNLGLYFLYCALTVEKSSEMHLHFCLNLRVFGSSLRFVQDLASMVLSKMEYILLIQNCTSKIANCSSFNNKWRHHDFTAILKNGGQLHDFIIALNISVFFGLWLLLRENWLNLDSVNYACPDCAREMLESCSLECQKGEKQLPKIQKNAT